MRWLALVVLIAGCGKANPYACTAANQCVRGGETGICSDGACAFADPSCPSGYRVEPASGGACIAGSEPDAAVACGAIGQACCTAEPACVAGASCAAGTCTTCTDDVALGRRFGCILEHDQSVWCAGDNANGQLGTGGTGMPTAMRQQVVDATGPIADATAISAGRDHACALRAGGSVWCWGAGFDSKAVQITKSGGPLTGMTAIEAGYEHDCALDGGGEVWCWGTNSEGELGDGTTTGRGTAAPVLVAAAGAAFTGAVELSVGAEQSCARKASGEVWCWGRNADGELGDGTQTNRTSPVKLATATTIGAALWHTCFVDADSTVSCVGSNNHARLGIGTGAGFQDGAHVSAQKVLSAPGGAPFTGATKVAGGGVTCAITTDASLYCWGDNHYGEVGTGDGSTVPAKVPIGGVDRVEVRYAHACAHTTDGRWSCWGRNTEGELGDGSFEDRGLPEPLEVTCP